MSHNATITLCILWEDELRTAARLLAEMQAADNDTFQEKARAALQASLTALHGLTDDKTAVMLSTAELKKSSKKKGKAVTDPT